MPFCEVSSPSSLLWRQTVLTTKLQSTLGIWETRTLKVRGWALEQCVAFFEKRYKALGDETERTP